MSIVRISSLIKRFGNFTALDGIDLEVKRGEIYGFIGPNGAGKTTTIRVLLGILKATGVKLKYLEWMHGRMQWKYIESRICSWRSEPLAQPHRR